MTIKYSRSYYSHLEEELQAHFEKAISFFEKGSYAKSLEHANAIGENLPKIIEQLVEDYGRVMDSKFSGLRGAQNTLSELNSKDIAQDLPRFVSLLVQMEKSLALVKKEIQHNYPNPSHLMALWGQKKRTILAGGLVGLAIALLGVFSWNFQMSRRGLTGEYFASKELKGFYKRRVDSCIRFNWKLGSPFPRWKKDNFSVRWTGYLHVPADGIYEFQTASDDGVSLWINGANIISNWTNHSRAVNKAMMPLRKGYYAVRLEYFDAKLNAEIQLFWKKETDSQPAIIPSTNLVPRRELLKSDIPLIIE